MCCTNSGLALAVIRRSGKWIWAWKNVCFGGQPIFGTKSFVYRPGVNWARPAYSTRGRWNGRYNRSHPAGCHAWRYRARCDHPDYRYTRLRVKIFTRDIVRADRDQVVCRKLHISTADWLVAGMDKPKARKT